MLFMVIERFKGAHSGPVGERFRCCGWMMPESPGGSGIAYVASWMAADGGSCHQIMEAPDRAAPRPSMANRSDRVEFEVVEVVGSAEFWKAHGPASGGAPG